VIDETSFGADFATNDPTVKQIVEDAKVSKDELRKVGKAVRSIKVRAVKASK
jgi:hypothetical protein